MVFLSQKEKIYLIWNHFSLTCFKKSINEKKKADERTRTVNLLITSQLLCQLSHIGVLYQILFRCEYNNSIRKKIRQVFFFILIKKILWEYKNIQTGDSFELHPIC